MNTRTIVIAVALLSVSVGPWFATADPGMDIENLYLRRGTTGVGVVDHGVVGYLGVIDQGGLSTDPPTASDSAVTADTPIIISHKDNDANFDVTFSWAPEGGFSYDNVGVDLTIWATTPDRVTYPRFGLMLAADGDMVTEEQYDYEGTHHRSELVEDGVPAAYKFSFPGPVSFAGDELTLTIFTAAGPEWATLFYYDSTEHPAQLTIHDTPAAHPGDDGTALQRMEADLKEGLEQLLGDDLLP